MLFAVRFLLPLAAIAVAAAQPANPFAQRCPRLRCRERDVPDLLRAVHGIKGQGGQGPDLSRGAYNSGDRDADMFRTISRVSRNRNGGLRRVASSDDNIWRMVTFIRAISRSGNAYEMEGDAAQGGELYRS